MGTVECLTWTRSQKKFNEDAVAATDSCLVVADGATALDRNPMSSFWTAKFASALARYTSRAVSGSNNVTAAVQEAIQKAQTLSAVEGNVTSTLTVATWNARRVTVACIGDSPALVTLASGHTEVVLDPAFRDREPAMLDSIKKHVDSGMSWNDAYSVTSEKLAEDRAKRNTALGVWIVSSSTPANRIAPHFYVKSWNRTDVTAVAILSDGAYALAENFGIADIEELAVPHHLDLDELWEKAEELQLADPERARYPRLSDRDDATIAAVKLAQRSSPEHHFSPSCERNLTLPS